MSFQRELWTGVYLPDAFPAFQCPRCLVGKAVLDQQSIRVEDPTYAKEIGDGDDWSPDCTTERFVAVLRCKESACGEVVAISGEIVLMEHDDKEHGRAYVRALRPRSMCKAPPIIAIPKNASAGVKAEIALAFQLYWTDYGSCASRLRTSVELLLDDFKIPRERMDRNGKVRRIELVDRIRDFASTDPNRPETLAALKTIGHLGTRGHDVTRDELLDALEVYEVSLPQLYDQRIKRIAELKKKLLAKVSESRVDPAIWGAWIPGQERV
jgi:hypothetical protein